MLNWMVATWAAVTLALLFTLGRALRESQRLRDRLKQAALELQSLQMAFSRFAPSDVIEKVIAEGATDFGEKKQVTVLFADIVGFTALSESLEPSQLVRILNGYFDRMSIAIEGERGHVSTFIGDGILALFGALVPNPWQGNDAARAALAMQVELEAYNRELEREGLPTLAIGIGLHCGPGVAGLVGSRQLKEFAFVGRTVNVAARVQDLTRIHDADIITTEDLKNTLDPRFKLSALPEAMVKGVDRPLSIFALREFSDESKPGD